MSRSEKAKKNEDRIKELEQQLERNKDALYKSDKQLARYKDIENKVESNINKWGLQDRNTLVLAMTEELGELAQACLKYEHENGFKQDMFNECMDLIALCFQFLKHFESEQNE